jgi:hypothetical protein
MKRIPKKRPQRSVELRRIVDHNTTPHDITDGKEKDARDSS